jgi:uncharacterized protein (TIGR02147 family)
MPETMPAVFDYMNYRDFLRDYYLWRKKASPSFSYMVFARKVGFGSKSFLPHVMEGKRDLTQDSIFQISQGLGLDPKSMSYFEDLVAFNQSKDPKQRTHFFTRLASHKKATKARFILRTELKFFSDWYHSTIRELVTFYDFNGDFAILAKAVRPRITANQAAESVALLLELGLIRKEGNLYAQSDRRITTGDEVRSMTVQKFHSQNLRVAEMALEKVEPQDRDVSCMIVGLSKAGFDTVKRKIQVFRKELTDVVSQDGKSDKVYHINFQFFPTSGAAEGKP